MKGVQCFVSIMRRHVARGKGNMLSAAAMRLNVQPDVCAIICSWPCQQGACKVWWQPCRSMGKAA